MKQLTCEMCGSTDLVKDGGVFICQSCGCKYSVEEAKKMMIEGTVEVKGTVKVDRSDELNKLFELANRAREERNLVNCVRYYDEILLIDPQNWEAQFFLSYCKFGSGDLDIDILPSKIDAFRNGFRSSINLVLSNEPLQEQPDSLHKMFSSTFTAFKNINDAIKSTYDPRYATTSDAQKINKVILAIVDVYGTIADVGNVESLKPLYYKSPELVSDIIEGHTKMIGMFELCQDIFSRYNIDFSGINDLRKEKQQFIDASNALIKEQKEKAKIEYWKKHADEKTVLESEINMLQSEREELVAKIDEINSKKESVPAMGEHDSVKNRIKEVEDTYNKLGIFKRAEKKQLQEELDKLNEEKDRLWKKVTEQQKVFNAEKQPLIIRKEEIDKRIKQINGELMADR